MLRSITPPTPSTYNIHTHKNNKYYSLDTNYNYERRLKTLLKNKTIYQDDIDSLRMAIQKEINMIRLLIKTLENTDDMNTGLKRRLQLYRGCDMNYYHLILGKIQGETHRYELTASSIKEKEEILRQLFIELQEMDALYKDNERALEIIKTNIKEERMYILETKKKNWWKGVIRCL